MVDEAKTRQWDGRLAWVIAAVALQCLTAGFAEAKTVGIWMDRKSGNITGATNSLAKAGWRQDAVVRRSRPLCPQGRRMGQAVRHERGGPVRFLR